MTERKGSLRQWVRTHVLIDRDPKCKKAGWVGVVVFERLIRMAALYGRDGEFPEELATPENLSHEFGLPAKIAEEGLVACLTNNLVSAAHGVLRILGWHEWQYLGSSAERMRRFRRKTTTPKSRKQSKIVTYRDDKPSQCDAPLRCDVNKNKKESESSLQCSASNLDQPSIQDHLSVPAAPSVASPHKQFVEAFTDMFLAARGEKPTWGPKEGANVKTLLKKAGSLEVAISRARRMFDMCPEWPANNPDLGTLVSHFDKFAPLPVNGSKYGGAKLEKQYKYAGGEVEI